MPSGSVSVAVISKLTHTFIGRSDSSPISSMFMTLIVTFVSTLLVVSLVVTTTL